jgi:hypothetical protein
VIVDSIAINDGGSGDMLYGGTNFLAAFVADSISRLAGNTDRSSTLAWFGGDTKGSDDPLVYEDGRTLRLTVPEALPLCTWHGRRIAGFDLLMDTDSRRITRCTFEGRSLLGDNDLIFGIVILAMTHYQHSKSHLMAEQSTLEFLAQHVEAGASPMCGNSICQDRRFMARLMPGLEEFFHYRNLDVSTVKELARRWAPELAAGFNKEGTHLALDDIRESVRELQFYREHFFVPGVRGAC